MQQRGLRQSVTDQQYKSNVQLSWDDKRSTVDMDMKSRPFDPLLDAALGAPYVFDNLFTPDNNNHDLYTDVIKEIVDKSLKGYHGVVSTFTYLI